MTVRCFLPVRLPMYDWPDVHDATLDLESALQGALSAVLGIDAAAFRASEPDRDLLELWTDPDLLLSQTCGFPLTHALSGRVRLVGAPHYAAEGCAGPVYRSQLVVRRDSGVGTLADLAGHRAAVNNPDSQSGMNTFRHALARLGAGRQRKDRRFFSQVVDSGGHLNSMRLVAAGEADIASVDAVCWWLVRRDLPELAALLKPIGETAPAPGLPLITSLRFSEAEVDLIASAVEAVLSDPRTRESRERLGLRGFSRMSLKDYDAIPAMARDAETLGYPVLT